MVENDNMVLIFGSKLTERSGFPFNIVLMENKLNIADWERSLKSQKARITKLIDSQGLKGPDIRNVVLGFSINLKTALRKF